MGLTDAMRLTSAALATAATITALAACGSAAPSAAAEALCDAYAQPGAGTVQRLADTLEPGDTGCLRGGRYEGTGFDGYVLVPSRGGRRGNPITIRSAPGERAHLRGVIYQPPGIDHIRLSHVDIDARHPQRPEDSQIGIQLLGDHATIAASDITTHANQTCLIATAGARRTIIRGNVFHECGDPGNRLFDHAVYAADTRRARIVGNVFVRTSGWAVHLYPGARGTYVARNLMWDNGGAVIFAGDENLASNNNTVVDNVMGASKQRPELTSSYGGPIGRGNIARDNCLTPGLLASEGRGFTATGNRVADGETCLGEASGKLVTALRGVAPALVARLR